MLKPNFSPLLAINQIQKGLLDLQVMRVNNLTLNEWLSRVTFAEDTSITRYVDARTLDLEVDSLTNMIDKVTGLICSSSPEPIKISDAHDRIVDAIDKVIDSEMSRNLSTRDDPREIFNVDSYVTTLQKLHGLSIYLSWHKECDSFSTALILVGMYTSFICRAYEFLIRTYAGSTTGILPNVDMALDFFEWCGFTPDDNWLNPLGTDEFYVSDKQCHFTTEEINAIRAKEAEERRLRMEAEKAEQLKDALNDLRERYYKRLEDEFGADCSEGTRSSPRFAMDIHILESLLTGGHHIIPSKLAPAADDNVRYEMLTNVLGALSIISGTVRDPIEGLKIVRSVATGEAQYFIGTRHDVETCAVLNQIFYSVEVMFSTSLEPVDQATWQPKEGDTVSLYIRAK